MKSFWEWVTIRQKDHRTRKQKATGNKLLKALDDRRALAEQMNRSKGKPTQESKVTPIRKVK